MILVSFPLRRLIIHSKYIFYLFILLLQIRFTSYTGSKSLLENLAHLPTKIVGFDDNKQPIFGRFTYRLMCHEVSKDIPLTFFEPRFDIGNQRMQRRDDATFLKSRSAHFDLAGIDINGKRERGAIQYNFLDSIMEEIPGINFQKYKNSVCSG